MMSLSLLAYWLVGGLAARASPEVLLSPAAVDWLGPSLLEGALFLAAFVAVAGLPRPLPETDGESPGPSRKAWLSIWLVIAILWGIRLYETINGQYFSHSSGSSLDASDPRTGAVLQLGVGLQFAPPLLAALLWKNHRRWAALAVGLAEFAFIFGAGERLPILWFFAALGYFSSALGNPPRISAIVKVVSLVFLVASPLILDIRDFVSASGDERMGPLDIYTRALPAALESLETLTSSKESSASAYARRSTASGYLAAVMSRTEGSWGSFFGGETYLQSATALVPHFLWSEKPDFSDPLDAINWRFDLDRVDNVFCPLSEGYCNFGTLGVLLVGLLYGLFGALLRRFAEASTASPTNLLALSPSLSILIVFETHSTVTSLSVIRLSIVLFLVFALARGIKGRRLMIGMPVIGVPSAARRNL